MRLVALTAANPCSRFTKRNRPLIFIRRRRFHLLFPLLAAASLAAVGEEARRDAGLLEGIAKAAIGAVLSFVLETPANVGGIHWNDKGQFLELSKLTIRNPRGFEAENAISVDSVRIEADPKLLFAPEPQIRLVQVKGATVNAEVQVGKGMNLKRLMDSANRFNPGGKLQPPGPSNKQLRIEKGVLDECTVNVVTTVLGVASRQQKKLDRIEMSFGPPGGGNVPADQALAQFLGKLIDELGIVGEDAGPKNLIDALIPGKR